MRALISVSVTSSNDSIHTSMKTVQLLRMLRNDSAQTVHRVGQSNLILGVSGARSAFRLAKQVSLFGDLFKA